MRGTLALVNKPNVAELGEIVGHIAEEYST